MIRLASLPIFHGIGSKIFNWVLLLSLLPLGALGWLGFSAARNDLAESAEKLLQTSLTFKSKHIGDIFATDLRHLSLVANNQTTIRYLVALKKSLHASGLSPDAFVKSFEWLALQTEFQSDLREFQNTFGYRNLLLIDPSGHVLYAAVRNALLGDNLLQEPMDHTALGRAVRQALTDTVPVFSGWEYGDQNSNLSLDGYILQPIMDNQGHVLGLVAQQVDFEKIDRTLEDSAGLTEGLEIYLVGEDQLMQSSSHFSRRITQPRQKVDTAPVRHWLAHMKDAKDDYWKQFGVSKPYVNYRNSDVLGLYIPVRELETINVRWILIAEVDTRAAFASIAKLQNVFLTIFIATALLVLLLSVWVTRMIVKPIDILNRAATAIGHGKFETRIAVASKDEIGELAQTFNRMGEMLCNIMSAEKQVNAQLRDTTELNEKVLKIAPYGVILFQAESGNCVLVNPAAGRIVGAPCEQVLKYNFKEIVPWRRTGLYDLAMETIRSNQDSHTDLLITTSFNKTLWLSITFTTLYIQEKKHLLCFLDDITERKNSEHAILQAKQEAELANQTKSQFLSNMSHEIRTPMNGVLGMIDLALGSQLSPKVSEYLQQAKISSRSLLGVINDILDFSKVEAGKLTLDPVDFYLDDLLDGSIAMFRKELDRKNIELIVSVPRQFNGVLVGDELRLRQILTNLLSNAIKFTVEGEIVIRVAILEQTSTTVHLQFSVKDTGIGLARDQMTHLFEAFSQADGSTTRKYGGTGLGLTICKRLVTLMSGEIGVDSVVGEGSLFYFTVSLGYKAAKDRYRLAMPEEDTNLKVLVVDDNDLTRTVFSEMFASFHFTVASTHSGDSALATLREAALQGDPFHLILLDWRMPGMDGIETATKLRHDPLFAPFAPKIIMMTGFGREDVEKKAQHIGVEAFLPKPVSPSVLLNATMDVFGYNENIMTVNKGNALDKEEIFQKLGGSRILLAEDHPINQQVACEVLRNMGIEVTVASDGQAAVDHVHQGEFDLVLMDIQMPILDGYSATRLLRSDPRYNNVPIIAMTAHALTGDRELCLAAGMDDYVAKPIDTEQLYATLVKWIKPRGGEAVSQARHAIQEKGDATIQNSLGHLPGIDVMSGLRRLGGNAELYRTMLGEFYRDYWAICKEIKAALEDDTTWEKAKRLVHSIKGVAGNLSAQSLFQSAKILERVINDGQRHQWPALLAHFEADLNQVLQSTHPLCPKENTPAKNESSQSTCQIEINRDRVASILVELSNWVRRNDIRSLDYMIPLRELLLGTPATNELDALEKALDHFDFLSARTHLESLALMLQISVEKNTCRDSTFS
ncbi:MAG: response regulator [Magnetococcales bacterium]|nr:response regulator [Magnetococcales bacterium]